MRRVARSRVSYRHRRPFGDSAIASSSASSTDAPRVVERLREINASAVLGHLEVVADDERALRRVAPRASAPARRYRCPRTRPGRSFIRSVAGTSSTNGSTLRVSSESRYSPTRSSAELRHTIATRRSRCGWDPPAPRGCRTPSAADRQAVPPNGCRGSSARSGRRSP